ncbi:unnamed protein product [Rotaria sp. Silwood1]|nr:unnamed protein product [Rotaria sp. Silwood1]CAF5055037.1 unnamed protein product [Rotaria sp. Silwood1]
MIKLQSDIGILYQTNQTSLVNYLQSILLRIIHGNVELVMIQLYLFQYLVKILLLLNYNIFPSIYFNKRWQPFIVDKENEVIRDMKSNENNLGLIINNDNKNESRLEARSIKSFELV